MRKPQLLGDEVSTACARIHQLRADVYDAYCRKEWGEAIELARRLESEAHDLWISISASVLKDRAAVPLMIEQLMSQHSRHRDAEPVIA